MKICSQLFALFLLGELQGAVSFQPNSFMQRRATRVAVASRDLEEVETQQKEESIPYIVARGDGSTGGGGLPMPHASEDDDDGLTRPKVGAEMPEG